MIVFTDRATVAERQLRLAHSAAVHTTMLYDRCDQTVKRGGVERIII